MCCHILKKNNLAIISLSPSHLSIIYLVLYIHTNALSWIFIAILDKLYTHFWKIDIFVDVGLLYVQTRSFVVTKYLAEKNLKEIGSILAQGWEKLSLCLLCPKQLDHRARRRILQRLFVSLCSGSRERATRHMRKQPNLERFS